MLAKFRIERRATSVKLRQLFVAATDFGIGRELRPLTALLSPRRVIEMIFVTHTKPLDSQAAAGWGCQGRRACISVLRPCNGYTMQARVFPNIAGFRRLIG